MVLAALAAMAPEARAGEDDEADEQPKRRGLIVTVDDTEDETAIPKKKGGGQAAPEEGAPESEINAYLRALNKDIRDTKADLKAAQRAGDADEALRLKDELREKKILLSDEESRLTTRDPALTAVGGTLTALGSLSLVSSVVLLFVWAGTSIDGYPDDAYGWGALGTLGGGVLGLSAGIPMIVIGTRRQVRAPDDAYQVVPELAPGGYRPAVGLTMSLSF